eukprot:TRINITY_DN20869_c0_g2_i1.p1 TRINITY_DN20869_c0_g2~~TRINITY_DN20869_c0_g2_i1.p1  ORF type:complete len:1242 (+),score=326.48 TRINITY_DN20869_c0_g2_i1:147-3872(+)
MLRGLSDGLPLLLVASLQASVRALQTQSQTQSQTQQHEYLQETLRRYRERAKAHGSDFYFDDAAAASVAAEQMENRWWASDRQLFEDAHKQVVAPSGPAQDVRDAASVHWWSPAFSMRKLLDAASSAPLPLSPEEIVEPPHLSDHWRQQPATSEPDRLSFYRRDADRIDAYADGSQRLHRRMPPTPTLSSRESRGFTVPWVRRWEATVSGSEVDAQAPPPPLSLVAPAAPTAPAAPASPAAKAAPAALAVAASAAATVPSAIAAEQQQPHPAPPAASAAALAPAVPVVTKEHVAPAAPTLPVVTLAAVSAPAAPTAPSPAAKLAPAAQATKQAATAKAAKPAAKAKEAAPAHKPPSSAQKVEEAKKKQMLPQSPEPKKQHEKQHEKKQPSPPKELAKVSRQPEPKEEETNQNSDGAEDEEIGNDPNTIHLTMLSNRQVGAAAAMESVCRNAAEPSRLRFHVIGPGRPGEKGAEGWMLQDLAPSCWDGDAQLLLYSLEEMTARVEEAGFSPVWKWPVQSGGAAFFSVRPAEWDNSDTHRHPFNLLRFYLPHIAPFKKLTRVIFLDDDVIILKDVAQTWDEELRHDAVMTASCQNWVWSSCDRFESSETLSYLEVPYFGFGRIDKDRSLADAACRNSEDRECLPQGLLDLLGNASVAINGNKSVITLDRLKTTTAWNYGYNKFDLVAWRRLRITEKYADWSKLNYYYKVFPETSLAFGLGISMLVKMGHVQCFDSHTEVLQGLGFIGIRDLREAKLDPRKAFGLHFNGPRKPWDKNSANPYANFFLDYAQDSWREGFAHVSKLRLKARMERERRNFTSFVVLTDPRSGSEWFMDMLDRHPEVCASGEAAESSVGFPSEALIPGRYIQEAIDVGKAFENLVQSQLKSHLRGNEGMSLLSMESMVQRRGKAHVDGVSLRQVSSKVHRTCRVKTACSWGNVAPLVWTGADSDVCDGSKAELVSRQEELGLIQLTVACNLLNISRKRLMEKRPSISSPTRVQLAEEAFRIYFNYQMRDSLRINDADFVADSEHENFQLLPCRCGRTALITGTKVMHDWIGDLKVSFLKDSPWGMNYNAHMKQQSSGMELPSYDLLGAMQEVGSKVVLYTRKNFLARYVSLLAANQTSIYHCTSKECVETATKVQVHVDVHKFRNFVAYHRGAHVRNRRQLEKRGLEFIELFYEDCQKDTSGCLHKVTKFLGVSPPPSYLQKSSSRYIRTKGDLAKHISNAKEVRKAMEEDGEDWLDN